MPQDSHRAFDYTETYVRSGLTQAPWENGARRIFATLFSNDTAWTNAGSIDGPALITWIQNEAGEINTSVVKL